MRFTVIFVLALWSVLAQAQSQPAKILVVHSYHQGFFWTDAFQRGFASAVEGHELNTRVLYLDSKRNQSQPFLEQLYSLYQTKLREESFDAVVVSDNIALQLMQRLAPELGETPVIFGGINNYRPELHRGLKATGITEDIDLLSNVSLIERLQPEAQQIWIVTDHSVTGEALRDQVDKFLELHPEYRNKVAHLVPDNMAELITQVSQMDPSQAVLFWAYYRDKQGLVSVEKDWRKLNQTTKAPIYLVHDLGIGYGAVGGVIQSGYNQGRDTASMMLAVLSQPDTLPKVEVGQPEIKLDYQAVVRWGLGAESESASVFFNKPASFADRYEQELRVFGSLFIIAFLVITFLVYYLNRIRKSEALARESRVILESIFDQSLQYIGILDTHGLLKSGNNQLQDLLYHHGMLLDKPLWHHKHWDSETRKTIADYFLKSDKQIETFEGQIWNKEQGSLVLEVSLKPLSQLLGREQQYLFEARDITSRKMMENKLYQRESSLRNDYEQQPVMMITLDASNRIQQVNRFAQQLLGLSQMEMLGHRLQDFYCDENALIPRQVLLQPNPVMKGVWRRDIEYRHADGREMWVRENIRPLVESGQILIVGEDISHTKALAKQLEYQARYDSLTDTYNRNQFEVELEKALREVENHRRVHAMLYLDLDQLKVLNDTAGHEAGDAAIQFCASMLEEVLPYHAILARMGGDEFAILLKDSTEVGATAVAKSIITTLSEQPFLWDEIKLNLTCSIGIRVIDHTATSPQMVHAQADSACHAAKEQGRNRHNLFSFDNEEMTRRQQEMESVSLVHHALANDRLELFAQRILTLAGDDTKMHFEILVRIRNAENKYISPGIFMPASERYNVAHLIDTHVVTHTLEWFECHPEALEKLGMCSINLSGHSMGNRAFIEFLLARLAASCVPCDKLCLEITETAAMSNMSLALDFFTQVKKLGCLIALDDFGSGLSSFGYLKQLPVDIVKIDGLFVRDMDTNEMDRLMVRSINDIAKKMGKLTVAEFVENTQIIDHLLELGVDYGQGYVIGHPKPLGELVHELMTEQAQ